MNRQRFADLIGMLCSVFNVESSNPMLDGYWLALKDIPAEGLERAVERSIKECRFMPKPAELRDYSGAVSTTDRALLAWAHVIDALRLVGTYESVDLGDPAAHEAVRAIGGWVWLGEQDTDQLERYESRRFIDAYRVVARRNPHPTLGVPLVGKYEHSNSSSGYAVEPPVSRPAGYLDASAPKQLERA
jgi:hypothetical protein